MSNISISKHGFIESLIEEVKLGKLNGNPEYFISVADRTIDKLGDSLGNSEQLSELIADKLNNVKTKTGKPNRNLGYEKHLLPIAREAYSELNVVNK
ncbi:TPA: hypothetical protein I7296_23120 [Vibrio parahaemolyticus]|nr:hypothetical protein [Vibrio parahaemolyticus]